MCACVSVRVCACGACVCARVCVCVGGVCVCVCVCVVYIFHEVYVISCTLVWSHLENMQLQI